MATKNANTHEDTTSIPVSSRVYRGQSLRRWGLIVSVFLAIWSIKLAVIDRFGTDIPYWDQWAKEGELMYVPWFEHHEFWRPLFVPHNEHRIAPTLALNLGLLRLGGNQWDARVQCVASAALHALLMAGLLVWARRNLGGISGRRSEIIGDRKVRKSQINLLLRRGAVVALPLFVVLVAAPPIAWENVLGGFQSQFYFLAAFSLLAIAGLLGASPRSWRWWGGIVAAALACVSMGSGMLVAFPIAVIAAARIVRRAALARARAPRAATGTPAGLAEVCGEPDVGGVPSPREFGTVSAMQGEVTAHTWTSAVTLTLAAAIGAIGWWFRPQAPWNAAFHAHGIWASFVYAARCLAWPRYDVVWLAFVFWAPWAILAWRWARRQFRTDLPDANVAAADVIVAAGVWVLAQVAAVTYSRAGISELPAPRYGDIFALGLLFNAFALAWLAGDVRRSRPSFEETPAAAERVASAETAGQGADRAIPSRGFISCVLLWAAVVIIAVGFASRDAWRDPLPRKKAEAIGYERNVHAFVLTDDYATLAKASPIPFPMADWLARILRNPVIRPLLPASIAVPIHVPGLANAAEEKLGLPVLANRDTRTVLVGEDWVSPPLAASQGWWKIETAGDVGQAGATFELLAASDRHLIARIAPSKSAGPTWRAAYVRAPSETAVLHAHVELPARFIAFSDPIRVSTLSFWTWRLCEHAGWLVVVAFGALGGFLVLELLARFRNPAGATQPDFASSHQSRV